MSDKASSCPNCGNPISKVGQEVCKECGELIPIHTFSCPNCGCPVDNRINMKQNSVQYDYIHKQNNGTTKWLWIIIAVLMVVLIGLGYKLMVKFGAERKESQTTVTDTLTKRSEDKKVTRNLRIMNMTMLLQS